MKLINKVSLYLVALSLFTVSCQKNDIDVDPREQYVGTYLVSGTQSIAAVSIKQGTGILQNGNITNAKVVVSKGIGSDEVFVKLDGDSPTLTMKLESNTFFALPANVLDKTATGFSYYKIYDGRGSFVNNKINLTIYMDAVTDQVKGRSDTNVSGAKQ